MNASRLRELATRAGIEPGWRDAWAHDHVVADATLQALLGTLGFAAATANEVEASLARLQACTSAPDTTDYAAARAWLPAQLAGDGCRWGLAVQLYGLRTDRTWGIGDFSALASLMRGAAALGAAAVGVNPLHALFPSRPEHASPYSPSSRRFFNVLYIDVPAIEDFALCEAAQDLVAATGFQAQLQHVRAAARVRYGDVAALKVAVFRLLYQRFRAACLASDGDPRGKSFRRFQREQAPELRRFATFHTLVETRPEIDWRAWPAPLADPDSPQVAAFAAQRVEAIEYHEYLQWQAALQLQAVQHTARACNMSIGLYADLAVGADPTGAESWGAQALHALGATIGAPPDTLNLAGQDWELPPLDPVALAAAGHAPLAALWRSNMRCAGALRIDHIMGLERLYWIPAGASPADGAYVRYPLHKLLGLLAAQSRESQCMLIGEDLGTVPAGLREAMHAAGVLSYRLLYFEQHAGRFRAPGDYPAEALAAIGTHDLPPLPMWWAGEDIDLRLRLALWPSASLHQAALAERERDRHALLAALRREGLQTSDTAHEAPVEAVYALLARTPCKLLMVQLDDVLDMHVQANVPGTTDQHPNWRHRLPCDVSAALAHPRMRRIAHVLAEAGRSDRA